MRGFIERDCGENLRRLNPFPFFKRDTLFFGILLLLYGCAFKVPIYKVVVPPEQKIVEGEGSPLDDGGWEFLFPESYLIKEMVIDYIGTLKRLEVRVKVGGGWRLVYERVDGEFEQPLAVTIGTHTDGIRVFSKITKGGYIKSCKFIKGGDKPKESKSLSIPLKKPPFIK